MEKSIKKRNKTSLNKFKKNYWPFIFLMPFFLFYTVFNLYPTLFSFYISLTNWDALSGLTNKKFIGFTNYINLFTKDKFFFQAMGNTLFFMVTYIPLVIAIGLLLAVTLFNMKKFRRIFQTLNVLPYITTPVAIGVIFAFMFDWSTGIVNKWLINAGIIHDAINWLGIGKYSKIVIIIMLVWKNFGYYFVVYLAGLSTVPEELTEAAVVDGANKRQIFFKITMPFLKPITIFLVITSIISGLQLFDEPMLLFSGNSGAPIIGGPDRAALTGALYFFDKSFTSTSLYGYGAAISYGMFLFIIIFSLIGFKVFSRGEK
jgi:multiple sugar transport system permease protein/cellobiose transport system permease protein